jgi:hypothetical protein
MIEIQEMLIKSIKELISNSTSKKKLKELYETHKDKVHFIPFKYRIIGGILQSMNIQFGNFIEEIVQVTIKNKKSNILIEDFSIRKSNIFELSKETDTLIDDYITNCQVNNYSNVDLKIKYTELIKNISLNEQRNIININSFKHDIDVLFKDTVSNIIYYVEIKFNDDHDTGKFVDINRKLLKTYAYLVRHYKDSEVKPILLYFNNKKMKENIYLPEDDVIYRGKRFFDKFTLTKYEDLEKFMLEISEDKETHNLFSELYESIFEEK